MAADPYITRPYPSDEESSVPPDVAELSVLPGVRLVQGRIGPYQLVGELGAGRTSIVYAARRDYENGVQRVVAVKVLRRALLDQQKVVDRFVREGSAAMRVNHPSVCAVYDVGRCDDGVPYVTMEYLIGEPFSRMQPLLAQQRDPFSVACCVKLATGLCEGLQAVHGARDEHGRRLLGLHRQIHPHNVFAMFDGTARLLDLSGAANLDGSLQGSAGLAAHEYAYMAPEQIRGDELEASSDVWSLGVVLWEAVSGRHLFLRRSPVETAVAVLEGPIPNVTHINAAVHPTVAAVLTKMIERNPTQRYRSAREAGGELELALRQSFGPVSTSKLAGWLNALFPGCEEFRRRLVHHAGESTMGEAVRAAPIVPVHRDDDAMRGLSTSRQYNVPEATPVQPFTNRGLLNAPRRPSAEQTALVDEDELRALTANLEPMKHGEGVTLVQTQHDDVIQIENDNLAQPPVFPATPAGDRVSAPSRRITSPVPALPFHSWSASVGLFALCLLVVVVAGFVWRSSDNAGDKSGATPNASSQRASVARNEPAPRATEHDAQPAAPDEPAQTQREEPRQVPTDARVVEPPAHREKPLPTRPRHAQRPTEVTSAAPVPALGQVYLTAKQGTLYVLHGGSELATPTALRLPAGTNTIQVRRQRGGPTTSITVDVEAGKVIGIPLE